MAQCNVGRQRVVDCWSSNRERAKSPIFLNDLVTEAVLITSRDIVLRTIVSPQNISRHRPTFTASSVKAVSRNCKQVVVMLTCSNNRCSLFPIMTLDEVISVILKLGSENL